MNREQAKELAPIIKAFGDGEDVQEEVYFVPDDKRKPHYFEWQDRDTINPKTKLRIKPKPREFYVYLDINENPSRIHYCGDVGLSGNKIKVREILDDE